ncbi:MAG TPA: MraY family glycosyltransferase [Flavisolibacter sp.]
MLIEVLLASSVAFIITFLAIPPIIKVADEKKLFDLPDARKLHNRPIASLGGMGIFVGFFIAALLSVSNSFNPEFRFFFAAAIVIFFLGLKDDILVLSPQKKFIGQLIATAIVIHLGGIRIDSMYGLFGIAGIPDVVGILLSYVTIIVIINAFNLIDGVDGLAGGLGLVSTIIFGSYFLAADMAAYAVLSFAMAGSLVAFMIFNYNPAKIFMGDSGSLLLGLVNAILVIKFIGTGYSAEAVIPIESSVAIGFSVLIIPLLDTLRVFSLRIARGRSPFSPDRHHIHHLLLHRGLNHRQVTITCVLMNLMFVAMAFLGRSMGPNWLLFTMILTAFVMVGGLVYFRKPSPKLIVAHSYDTEKDAVMIQKPSRVLSLQNEAAVAEQ